MDSLLRALEITKIGRKAFNNILDNYRLEQLNYIPPKFANNLFWNIAHVVVTQQLLIYRLSGLPVLISEEWVKKYKKGTTAKADATQGDLEELKVVLNQTIKQTEKDINLGNFKKFSPYTTSIGFEIKTINDAFEFNNFHEGIHLGYVLALKKEVKSIQV